MPTTVEQHERSLHQPAFCELLPVRDIMNDVIIRTTGAHRGKEWHGPDFTVLNASNILLIEPVTAGSRVAQLIAAAPRRRPGALWTRAESLAGLEVEPTAAGVMLLFDAPQGRPNDGESDAARIASDMAR